MGGSSSTSTTTSVQDPLTGKKANVETFAGKERLLVNANISADTDVEVPLGQDPIPDMFFVVTAAGSIGDTIRAQIAATSVDTTTPDSDLVAVDFTYTLVSADVGKERTLAQNFAVALSADTNFIDAFLEASNPSGDRRAVVQISSTEFSLPGEFHERPNAGDVTLSVTGTTTVATTEPDMDKLLSRKKITSLSRDLDNPHRLGIPGFSGTATISFQTISETIVEKARTTGGSDDMAIDGTTPVDFFIKADPDFDKFYFSLRLVGNAATIKFGQFLNINNSLTNGLILAIKSDDKTAILVEDPVKTTDDIKHFFTAPASNWELDDQAGNADFSAEIQLSNPIVIRKQGTFTTDDEIKITVSDDLSSVSNLMMSGRGFKRLP